MAVQAALWRQVPCVAAVATQRTQQAKRDKTGSVQCVRAASCVLYGYCGFWMLDRKYILINGSKPFPVLKMI